MATLRCGQRLAELAAEGLHRGRIAVGQVPLQEDRLAQRRLQVRGAPLDEVLPGRLFHVMGLDLQQDLQIEFQGLLGRHPRDVLGKAAVGVAAAQVVVQPGQLETLLQDVLLGELPQALFIMGQGLAPTPLGFQFLAALQVAVDLKRSIGKSKGRSGRLLCRRRARPARPMPQTRERLPLRAFVAWCRPCGSWNAAWA